MMIRAFAAAAAIGLGVFATAQDGSISLPAASTGSHATGVRFDPAKMVTFKGRVIGIEISNPQTGDVPNVNLLVKLPNGGTALVELGPKSYVEQQKVSLKLRDEVTITGSKVFEANNDSAILATEISYGGRRVALRSPEGRPFWLARRR